MTKFECALEFPPGADLKGIQNAWNNGDSFIKQDVMSFSNVWLRFKERGSPIGKRKEFLSVFVLQANSYQDLDEYKEYQIYGLRKNGVLFEGLHRFYEFNPELQEIIKEAIRK